MAEGAENNQQEFNFKPGSKDDPNREVPGIPIPGETLGDPSTGRTPEQVEQDELEKDARSKGWSPKDEYKGDKSEWVDAREFLLRAPLFDKIKSQSKAIKSLKDTVDAMANQFQTQVKAQVQLRVKELQAEKRKAIELGDVNKVDEIDAEIDQQKQQAVEDKNQVPDEVEEWVESNQWFKTDQELNAFAIAHNRQYIQNHPGVSIADSLAATQKATEKAYPEKFKKESPPPPSPEGGGEPKGGNNKGYSMSRLSDEQKMVYQQMVKVHKQITHEEFFKGLDEIGELQ